MTKKLFISSFILCLFLSLNLPCHAAVAKTYLEKLQEHSHYAVLIDASTGKILWGRGDEVHREMASTTKMMTALLLLEHGHLNDIVTAPNGVQYLPQTSLDLIPGETITLHDLLYAMLLDSDNDAAVAGADYLSGSVPAFVDLMNQKAQEIGCDNTHYVTPNGLYAPDHYSTAADLAHIAAYALATQPMFDQIVDTQTYKIHRSIRIHDVWMVNTALTFLKTFPGANGVKTGYIRQAGHCFVGSATRNGWQLIAVALDSDSCREDVESILDYGYKNFIPTLVVPNGTAEGTVDLTDTTAPVAVTAGENINVVLPKNKPVPAFQVSVVPLKTPPLLPISAGEMVGTVMVMLDGKQEAAGPALAAQTVPAVTPPTLSEKVSRVGWTILKGIGAIAGVLMMMIVGGLIYGTAAKNARRRRRRLAESVRGVDPAGASAGKRPDYH